MELESRQHQFKIFALQFFSLFWKSSRKKTSHPRHLLLSRLHSRRDKKWSRRKRRRRGERVEWIRLDSPVNCKMLLSFCLAQRLLLKANRPRRSHADPSAEPPPEFAFPLPSPASFLASWSPRHLREGSVGKALSALVVKQKPHDKASG